MTTTTAMTLGEAAKATGKAKGTISRAISTGRLSADRRDDGQGYAIEPAELFRLYPPAANDGDAGNGAATPTNEQDTTAAATLSEAIETARATATMEADIKHLRELVAALQADKTAWQEQAKRSTLLLEHEQAQPRGIFARWFGVRKV